MLNIPGLLDTLIHALHALPEQEQAQWATRAMLRLAEVQAKALAGEHAEDQADAA